MVKIPPSEIPRLERVSRKVMYVEMLGYAPKRLCITVCPLYSVLFSLLYTRETALDDSPRRPRSLSAVALVPFALTMSLVSYYRRDTVEMAY